MGGYGDAIRFARSLVTYLNENDPNARAAAYVHATGDFGRIHLFVDYASVAAWESSRKTLMRDDDYLALFASAKGAFVDGTYQEDFIEVVF